MRKLNASGERNADVAPRWATFVQRDDTGANAMTCKPGQPQRYEQSPQMKTSAIGPNTGMCADVWLIAGLSLLPIAIFAAYAATLRFSFVYDDFNMFVYNPRVHSSGFLAQYFTQQVWGNNAGVVPNLYRPLFLTWLLVNYQLFGISPAGWHLTSIMLHLLATGLVFLLSLKLLGRRNSYAALISAALFGLHPIHVEAVAWVSSSTELLSACFFLGSVLCFIQRRSGRRIGWLSLSLFLFVGALMSKETAIVLPAVLLSYLLLFPENADHRCNTAYLIKISTTLLPYLVVAAGYLGIRYLALHGVAHSLSDRPLWSSILKVPWALQFYIRQWLLPFGLGPFYDIDGSRALNSPLLWLSLFFLSALALFVWWWTRKTQCNVSVFLYTWFFLTLGPALAILLLMTRYEGVHDRYLYLPSVGLSVLGGAVWAMIFPTGERHKGRRQQVLCAAALVTVLGFATKQQGEYWENDLVLFTRACAVAPQNSMARLNLAAELLRRGRFQECRSESQRVVNQDPHLAIAYSLAGEASFFLGDYAEAETDYLQSLKLSPASPKELYYLGMAQIKLRKYSEGVAVLDKALALWPDAPLLHYAMGIAFERMENWQGALEQYQLELKLHPQTPGIKATLLEVEQHLTPAAHEKSSNSLDVPSSKQ